MTVTALRTACRCGAAIAAGTTQAVAGRGAAVLDATGLGAAVQGCTAVAAVAAGTGVAAVAADTRATVARTRRASRTA
ncbi:MAG: hypothetical protein EPN59_16570 [Paraburkholderia sp.]|nr:MAG: hypothetical protein EPN59_16570 [Paraburkholderia sp.]